MPGFFNRLYAQDQPKVRCWIASWVIARSAQLVNEVDQQETRYVALLGVGNAAFMTAGFVALLLDWLLPLGFGAWLAIVNLGHVVLQRLISRRSQQERHRIQAAGLRAIDTAISTFPRLESPRERLYFMRLVEQGADLTLRDLQGEFDRLPNLPQWPFWANVVWPALLARRRAQKKQ